MASLALGVGGALIGSAFGPLGASIGWTIGSALGNLLDPQKIEGPRLQDLHLHTSSYGKMTPLLYGTFRVAGNVIWIGNGGELVEHEETSGGKGGPEVTNYTYSASFAIRLVGVQIQGISKIFANGRLIWTADEPGDLPITLYLGTETQLPDPTMEADLGVGNVPGYRGVAYIVFADYFLTDFGNAIPNLEFVCFTRGMQNSPIVEEFLTIDNTNNPSHTEPTVLTAWPLHGGPASIRASERVLTSGTSPSVTPGDVYTWDGDPTLAWNDVGSITAADFWPQPIDTFGYDPTEITFGSQIVYYPIGMLVSPDGVLLPYWGQNFGGGPDIAGSDLDCSQYPASGFDWFDVWEIPRVEGGNPNVFLTGITTANNRSMFVFTSNDGTAFATHWYQIRANKIVRQGTVAPSTVQGGGNYSKNRYATTSGAAGYAFENNGEWLWSWQTNATEDISHGPGGIVAVSRIDPVTNVLARDMTAGVASVDDLSIANVTGSAGTCIAIGTGRFGVMIGNAVAIFRRISDDAGVPLSEIVADISDRVGFDASEYDVDELTDLVDGYLIDQQQTGRDDIQPLREAYFFDAVESDDVVKFVKRKAGSILTIPADDLAARTDGEEPPPIVGTVRAQELELPQLVTINYVNPAADWQVGSQTSQRQVTNSQSSISLDLKIAMTDAKAKSVADTQLLMSWVERNRHTAFASRKYAQYEPTDVITADGHKFRVVEKSESRPGVLKFDGVGALAPVLIQAGIGNTNETFTSTPGSSPTSLGTTNLVLFDVPLAYDTDEPNGIYAAASGNSSGWPGVAIFKSTDGGSTYSQVFTSSTPSTMGESVDELGAWTGENIFDETNVVTIELSSGSLASANETAVLGGANLAVLGSEIFQFKNAELVGADTYELSGLLRGRRGTEWATSGHGIGEDFALFPLHRVASPIAELNLTRQFKPVTLGDTVASATAQTFTNSGNALKPYAPVLLGGGCDASGNVTLNWTRRTRIGGEWRPFVDVPLSESIESYIVQIWNADYSQVARIITASSATASYSSAQQVSDFGGQQQTLYFSVAQIGAAGVGFQARGSVRGAGASDDDPISAVPPYQSPTSGSPSPPPDFDALNMFLTWGALGSGNVRGDSSRIGGFNCSKILVARFTTPNTTAPNAIGRIQAGYRTAPSVVRTACLSTVAGDFSGAALGPNSLVQGTSVTVWFSVGSNDRAFPTPELAANTTYYYNIKNDDGHGVCTCPTSDCAMMVELAKPPGL